MTSWADLFTIVTGVIAVIAVVGSVSRVTRAIVITRLIFAKFRIALFLRRSAPDVIGTVPLLSSILRQAHAITGGRSYSLAQELEWLSTVCRAKHSVAFDLRHRALLAELSDLYSRLGSGLQIRTLLLGGSQPVLEQVAAVARRTAVSLGEGAINLPLNHMSGSMPAPSWLRQVTSYESKRLERAEGVPSVVEVETFHLRGAGVAHGLHVSWSGHGKDVSEAPQGAPEHPRQYNGLLPRLTNHRYERSLANGNYRLHVELGEIYYDAHVRESDPRLPMGLDETVFPSALLTLSILPITTDGFLIVARRGEIAFYPDCWGPGAGGNLEIPTFGSAVEDTDQDGVIDPLKAVARETREELGLVLHTDQVQPLGLARISNAEERGTYLLPTLAATGLTLRELSRATAQSNAVSGRWEIGDVLAAIPLPRSVEEAADLLGWALGSPECMPHLAANLMQLISFATPLPLTECLALADDSRRGRIGRRFLPEGAIVFPPGSELPEMQGSRREAGRSTTSADSRLRRLLRRMQGFA